MEKPVVICIDASKLSEHAYNPIFDGVSAIDRVFDFAHELRQQFSADLIIIADRTTLSRSGTEVQYRDEWSRQDVVSMLLQYTAGLDRHASVCVIRADAPLPIYDETVDLLLQHQRYFAHYSFCDGYPAGCTPEIVSVEALHLLKGLAAENMPFTRLFDIIEKDINAFDIETRISPQDFRLLRLELRADSRRNLLLTHGIYSELQGITENRHSAQQLITVLNTRKDLFRTLPASLNLVLHTESSRPAIYMPELPSIPGIPAANAVQVAMEFAELVETGTVVFSHLGEPSEYEHIYSLILKCAQLGLDVVIETDGIGWDYTRIAELSTRLGGEEQRDRVTWIVFLDTLHLELYRKIRPAGDLQKAIESVDTISAAFPESVYVQATRMGITEPHLLEFYREWKKKTDRIIIQKYNHYAGRLPDHQVTNTAPITRMPCWRLKREITVLPDGTVTTCHVDVIEPHSYGKVLEEPLHVIWQKMAAVYQQHIDGRYPKMCEKCDEYYTFTF
ncbi:MAG: spiro-SPASM protein [Spirochaeta sp.]